MRNAWAGLLLLICGAFVLALILMKVSVELRWL